MTMLRSFSWQCGINRFVRQSLSSSALAVEAPDLPRASGYRLKPGHPSPGRPILLRPSITRHRKYRNMNRFSFDYAFRPRLRYRLTLGGLTWPRNPWTFGVRVSRPHFRYSCQHPHFPALHHGSHHSFSARGTLPYHRPEGRSAASAHGLSPVIFSVQARLTSELLRFL